MHYVTLKLCYYNIQSEICKDSKKVEEVLDGDFCTLVQPWKTKHQILQVVEELTAPAW
jgi:hypothetical protein